MPLDEVRVSISYDDGSEYQLGERIPEDLREGGFNWGANKLDEFWTKIVEKAVKKKFSK